MKTKIVETFRKGLTTAKLLMDGTILIEHAGNMGNKIDSVINNFNLMGLKWDEYDVVEEKGSPNYFYKATLKSKGMTE